MRDVSVALALLCGSSLFAAISGPVKTATGSVSGADVLNTFDEAYAKLLANLAAGRNP
jgi:hypothetical protein